MREQDLPPWRSAEDALLAQRDSTLYGTVFCEVVGGKRVRVDPMTVQPHPSAPPLLPLDS